MTIEENELLEIVNKFSFQGEVISITPFGNGHINRTFKIVTTEKKYILQMINSNVFKNVEDLMNNIVRVTEHLLEKNIETLKLRPTFDGKLYYEHNGHYYRMYRNVKGSRCFEGVNDLETIKKAGFAFGKLHCNLIDLDPNKIVDVIPNFHNTEMRYKNLLKSVANDPVDRVKNVKDILLFLNEHKDEYSLLVNSLEDGTINRSITHNDTKINNILFDRETNEVRCVIDLDTVMTGTYLFDFGDALRSLFTGENEDSKDLSKIKVNLDIYIAYLEGYYSQMKSVLNAKEINLLPKSVIILTLELAIRFLTDYLDGDIYFRTNYPEHNLDRTMTQITLAKELYENYDDLVKITNEICR